MKIQVEYLLSHTDATYDVGRIPCVGEYVSIGDDCHEVKEVIHILDPIPNQVKAIVRVK